MAADILLYDATHVPVGEDQKQHLELCRDIAQKFNIDYGVDDFLKVPEPLIQKEFSRIMSLKDVTKKMSKSELSDFSRINLTDDTDLIINKIKNSEIGKNCFSLENLSIKEILPVIKNCDLYIGNDTGFMHISAALGIKSIGIFVDTPAYSYSGYSDNIIAIVPEGETLESTTHDTLGKDKISFEEVFEKTNKYLVS